MSEYKAPIKDIQFLLKNITSKENNPSEYSDPELTNQIFQEAGKLASNVLAPLNKIGDQKGAILENGIVRMPSGFKNAYKQYIDAGWGSVAA